MFTTRILPGCRSRSISLATSDKEASSKKPRSFVFSVFFDSFGASAFDFDAEVKVRPRSRVNFEPARQEFVVMISVKTVVNQKFHDA